jgi:hypothetical protein
VMKSRHRNAIGLVLLTMMVGASVASAQTPAQTPQRKLSGDERAQYDALKTLTDAVAVGKQPAPTDAKLTLHSYFLRSSDGLYIPYTLEIEPGKISSFPAALYVRAVPANAAPTAKPPFEDITLVQDLKDNKLNRALQLAPGNYDLYIALREKPGKDKKAPAPHTVFLKEALQVPDLSSGLAMSSVILADNIEGATAPLSNEQQLQQPYVMSGYNITPNLTRTFKQSGNFNFVYFVYNEGEAAGADKPDLQIDMSFSKEGDTTPKATLKPQLFNAQTLPAEFSLKAGHVISVGSGVPLTTFAPGAYHFDVKVTDKTNNASTTHSETFTVTP